MKTKTSDSTKVILSLSDEAAEDNGHGTDLFLAYVLSLQMIAVTVL
jgi:hypothetical protein